MVTSDNASTHSTQPPPTDSVVDCEEELMESEDQSGARTVLSVDGEGTSTPVKAKKRKRAANPISMIHADECLKKKQANPPRKFPQKPVFTRNIFEADVILGKVIDCTWLRSNALEELAEYLNFQGWESLLNSETVYYPQALVTFLSNIVFLTENEFKTEVNGVLIFISPALLAEILCVPVDGIFEFNTKHVDVASLTEIITHYGLPHGSSKLRHFAQKDFGGVLARLLHMIAYQTVVPRTDLKEKVTFVDIAIMWCLEYKIQLSLPRIMISHIRGIVNDAKPSIPYPLWLMKVLKHFKVPLENFKPVTVKRSKYLAAQTLSKMSFEKTATGWCLKKAPQSSDTQNPSKVIDTQNPSEESTLLSFVHSLIDSVHSMEKRLLKRIEKLEAQVALMTQAQAFSTEVED